MFINQLDIKYIVKKYKKDIKNQNLKIAQKRILLFFLFKKIMNQSYHVGDKLNKLV